jgi:hypothetical protein
VLLDPVAHELPELTVALAVVLLIETESKVNILVIPQHHAKILALE